MPSFDTVPQTPIMRITNVLETKEVGEIFKVDEIAARLSRTAGPRLPPARVNSALDFYRKRGFVDRTAPGTYKVLKRIARDPGSYRASATTRNAIKAKIIDKFVSPHQVITIHNLLDFARDYKGVSQAYKGRVVKQMYEEDRTLVQVTPRSYKPGPNHPIMHKPAKAVAAPTPTPTHNFVNGARAPLLPPDEPKAAVTMLTSMAEALEMFAATLRDHDQRDREAKAVPAGKLLVDATKEELIAELSRKVALG